MNTPINANAAFDVYRGGSCDVCGTIGDNEYRVEVWSIMHGDDDVQYMVLISMCEKCLQDAMKFIDIDRSKNVNSNEKK
jgi:hypothetical protein